MKYPLTAGAWRVLQRTISLASHGASDPGPVHLLWSLLLDESRAAELLAQHGVEEPQLAKLHPLQLPPEPLATAGEAHVGPLGIRTGLPPFLDAVVQEARLCSSNLGTGQEAGSEHLLWGLAQVDDGTRELLERIGLTLNALREKVAAQSGTEVEPIDIDFALRVEERAESERHSAYRIIDAAANRAREGCRVLEDYTRFTLNDAHLSRRLKEWRHTLTAALQHLDSRLLLAARDTTRDVGTNISTSGELFRGSQLDIVRANLKRMQEASRTLEEYGKLLAPQAGRDFERLRYESYTLEKGVLQTIDGIRSLEGRQLYLLLTESLCHHGSGPAVRAALEAGVGIVQLREKKLGDREIIRFGQRVCEWTHAAGGVFIMNDRPDLAVLTGADGVHVGQTEISVRDARRIIGPGKLVGVSTHTIEQARQAVLDGADYIGVGPVFPSTTKSFAEFPGLELVRAVAAEIALPWFAIGGINQQNAQQVLAAGATRLAVSSAICSAEQPAEATATLLGLLRNRE